MAKRISIINFKGGVGKSTLAFHLATGLARKGSPVLLVDVDHQSSLSVMCLRDSGWEDAVDSGNTTNKIFSSFVQNGEFPGTEIIVRSPIQHLVYVEDRSRRFDVFDKMDLVPAEFQLDNTEIDLTRTIAGDPVRSEWDKRTLICRWI